MLKIIIKRLATEDTAQDLAEYGIALAVIGLGAALAAVVIATNVNQLWSKASDVIAQAV